MSLSPKKSISVKDLENESGAVGKRSDYKDHTDPKYIGPGHWNIIHRRSYNARTHAQQVQFIDFMHEVCEGFPCTVCKGHCVEYIKNHPLEDYIDQTVEIAGTQLVLGLFIWTWKFHNAVNARIGKPIMSWDTAYGIYSGKDSLVCSKSCMDADNSIHDSNNHSGIDNNNNNNNNNSNSNNHSNIPIPSGSSEPFNLITIHR